MTNCYCQYIPSEYKAKKCRKRSHKNYCDSFRYDESKTTGKWSQKFANLRKIWSYHYKVADLPLCRYNFWEDQSVKRKNKCNPSPIKHGVYPIKKNSNDFINSTDMKSASCIKCLYPDSSCKTKSILKKGNTSYQPGNVSINESPYYDSTNEKKLRSFNYKNNTASRCCKQRVCLNNHVEDDSFFQPPFNDDQLNCSKYKVKFSPSTEARANNIKSQYFDRKMRLYYDLPDEYFYQAPSFYDDSTEFTKNENKVSSNNENIKCDIKSHYYNRNMCSYNLLHQNPSFYDGDKSKCSSSNENYRRNITPTYCTENNHSKYKIRSSSGSDTDSTGSSIESRCCKRIKCPNNLQNNSINDLTIFDIYEPKSSRNKSIIFDIYNPTSSPNKSTIFDIYNPESGSNKSTIFDITVNNPKHKLKSSTKNITEYKPYNNTEFISRQKFTRNKTNTSPDPASNKSLKSCVRKEFSRKINKNISQKFSKQSLSSDSTTLTESNKYSSFYNRQKSSKSCGTSQQDRPRTGINISCQKSASKENTKTSASSKKRCVDKSTKISSSNIPHSTAKKANSSKFLRKTPAKSILPSKSFLKEKKKKQKLRKEKKQAKTNKVAFSKNDNQKHVDKYKNSDDLYHKNVCLKQLIDAVPSSMFPEVPDLQFQFKQPGKKAKYVLKVKNLLGNCHEKKMENEIIK